MNIKELNKDLDSVKVISFEDNQLIILIDDERFSFDFNPVLGLNVNIANEAYFILSSYTNLLEEHEDDFYKIHDKICDYLQEVK